MSLRKEMKVYGMQRVVSWILIQVCQISNQFCFPNYFLIAQHYPLLLMNIYHWHYLAEYRVQLYNQFPI